jgi:hypothetical protein
MGAWECKWVGGVHGWGGSAKRHCFRYKQTQKFEKKACSSSTPLRSVSDSHGFPLFLPPVE